MKNFAQKFKLIFIPWLLIAVATIAIVTFLHWALFIDHVFFNVDEEVLNLWAPVAVPIIPIFIWLRPRIKLLNLKNKSGKGDPLLVIIMFAWIGMAAPMAIAQSYLVTATGKLTKLVNINNIHNTPLTKYYQLEHFFVDKRLVKAKSAFEVTGKHNENFEMTLYTPCPIFNKDSAVRNPPPIGKHLTLKFQKQKPLIVINGVLSSEKELESVDSSNVKSITVLKGKSARAIYGSRAKYGAILVTTKSINAPVEPSADGITYTPDPYTNVTPYAWLAVKFEKTISNNLSADEKEAAFRQFAKESQQEFNAKDLYSFAYLDRMGYGADYRNYTSAITNTKFDAHDAPVIILSPVSELFEARNGNKLAWIFGSMGIGAIVFLILLLFKPLRDGATEIDIAKECEKEGATAIVWIKGLFSAKSELKATRVLIALNLLVFIVMVFSGLGFISFSGEDLLKWGANFRPSIQNGEYWRLFTCMFLHAGVMHILFNMYGLFIAGVFLEKVTGAKWFLILYLLTGVIASLTSVWWHPATISIGASGAIFGMYGVLFALLTTNVFESAVKKPMLINISVFIGYNLLYGLAGGIDNSAHVGGLLSGLLLGYIFYALFKDRLVQEPEADHQQLVNKLNAKSTDDITA